MSRLLPLSGFNAAAGKEGSVTAAACFDRVNKGSGIGGRKIVLQMLDDGFIAGAGPMPAQPGRCALNMRASTDLEIARSVKQIGVIGRRVEQRCQASMAHGGAASPAAVKLSLDARKARVQPDLPHLAIQ